MYNETVPNKALDTWYHIFLRVLDKHAPLRQQRVKYATLPPWLTADLIEAVEHRDELRREKRFTDYKKERNRVKSMVLKAKKLLFDKAIHESKDCATIWRAINLVTRGTNKSTALLPPHLTANSFNSHFVSAAESLIPLRTKLHDYIRPDNLMDFCKHRTAGKEPFIIPTIAVHEVGKLVTSLENKKNHQDWMRLVRKYSRYLSHTL